MYFLWNDALLMGIPRIDSQHQRMFEIGKMVSDLVFEKDQQLQEIEKVLAELEEYTLIHFRDEEQLLEECNYIERETHIFEHELFVKKLNRIKLKNTGTNEKEVLIELISFISDWITEHISKSDMRFRILLSE